MKHLKLGTVLTIFITILLLTYTFSWMVTEPSRGEIVDYHRELIISSASVVVETYIYENNDYVLYDGEDIVVNNMAPNDTARFKFVVKNTNQTDALVDVIFANIFGDIDVLKPYLTFNCSSPAYFSKNLENDLETSQKFNGVEVVNYMRFYDDFKIPAHGEQIIYWDIKLDKQADNSVASKTLKIENIMFINA